MARMNDVKINIEVMKKLFLDANVPISLPHLIQILDKPKSYEKYNIINILSGRMPYSTIVEIHKYASTVIRNDPTFKNIKLYYKSRMKCIEIDYI